MATRQLSVEIAAERPHCTTFVVRGTRLRAGDAEDIVARLSGVPGVGSVEVDWWNGRVECQHGDEVAPGLLARTLRASLGADPASVLRHAAFG